jgi:FlaA1/EpsC-like NDP-sugar epimerase
MEGLKTIKEVKRDVKVEELLGREAVKLDCREISGYLRNKTILVTGGGGSIGSELCRQIAKYEPERLLILDIYENNAYDLQNELKYLYPELNLRVLIASIRDKKRMDSIFREYSPQVVFHAAAHKHVPLMEENPSEAIKNNVFGTMNTAKLSHKYRVEKFVLISTDKAVNPTNVMGASKRICEMIIQSINESSKTEFAVVRFGNVLGSNGSVIPLFKRQIAKGGPVTVTDKRVTRYFMTIEESAQLVLQAGAYAEGGEIYVLDMGKPVRIYDLACNLIELSGFKAQDDIKIKITGLRPGEKLYEELLTQEEGLSRTKHNKIFVGKPTFCNMKLLTKALKELYGSLDVEGREKLIEKVQELVPSYKTVAEVAQTYLEEVVY